MIPSVRPRLLVGALLGATVLLAACGGAASPGASTGEPSAEPPASSGAIPSVDINIGGDLPADFVQALVPPSSSVTGSFTAAEGQAVIFHSTASRDELKSFYQSAFQSLGVQVISTVDQADGIVWIFAGEGSDKPSGLVTVGPGSDGGQDVTVTYGFGN